MHALARLIALGAIAAGPAACDRSPARQAASTDPQRPGPDGLVSFLEATAGAGALAGCVPPPSTFDALVTPSYRGHAPGVGAAGAARLDGPFRARTLYADDPAIPAALRRARSAVPVGRPPLIAFTGEAAVPALFVFDAGRWWCLIDLDGVVTARIDDAACRDAYRGSHAGRCLDLTAPVATAALDGDAATLARRCDLLVRHGCGSVAADAPDASPVPPSP